MPYDRAGYLNSCGGYGNRFNEDAAQNHINDSRLSKKELHYVETYVDNHNADFGGYSRGAACDNYGCGGGGYYDGGCGSGPFLDGPCDGPGFCGGFGLNGPYGGFGLNGPCGGPGFYGESGSCLNGSCNGEWSKSDKHNGKDDNKKDKNRNDPCNPFCKPCYKPICYKPPHDKPCGCDICTKSYKKIYKN